MFESVRAPVPAAVTSKLHYFVAITQPESFERLQVLRSEFWSFVAITVDQRDAGTVNSRSRP